MGYVWVELLGGWVLVFSWLGLAWVGGLLPWRGVGLRTLCRMVAACS